MRRLLFVFSLLMLTIPALPLTITRSGGWLESVCVQWLPVEGAEEYHVYVIGNEGTGQLIDSRLIRSYGSYFRADVPGLKAGNYSLKVVPVFSGNEGDGATSELLTVLPHDRTGFAFTEGRIPGAYQSDGTPKTGAVVVYVTQKNKDHVSLDVTGASENPCVGLQAILDGFKKGKDTRPLIVRLIGQITDFTEMLNGDIVVENDNSSTASITIEGIGDDAVADGWGIRIKNAANIEVRNIGFMNCNSDEGDNISLQQNNEYIWIHHCDLFYGDAGSDADQIKGDGALDCKKSTRVTFSYNHFWDTGKSNLLGLSEGTTDGLWITYHHNWYDHSDSRHPRVRYYSVHVYNNYYDGVAKYGVGSTMGSSVFVEANYFRNCKYPMLISMQGSDVYDASTGKNDYSDMPTFSKEDGGIIKAYNNYMTGQQRFAPYGAADYSNSTVDFDAWVASAREDSVPAAVVSYRGGNKYNNFDVNRSVMYTYVADSPEEARDRVMAYAGRLNGGDFKWAFDNALDDKSYAVNTALKAALSGYKTTLVAVQGDTISYGGDDPGGSDDPVGDVMHNFTLSGKTSSFFIITGNLSDSKGTVVYGDLTLTQCLKIESGTVISFVTSRESVLTLVFNADFNGRIKINDVVYTAASGIVSVTLPAGTHTITKSDSANLFYMKLEFASGRSDWLSGSGVVIYPNPISSLLTIQSEIEIEKIEIFGLQGKLFRCQTLPGESIDVSALNPGTYLMVLYSAEGVRRYTIQKRK